MLCWFSIVCLPIYIQGDIVLVGLRDFQEGKADIIHKYTAEEARNLQSYGELPATARINQTAIDMALEGGEEEDMGFDFDEVRLIHATWCATFNGTK